VLLVPRPVPTNPSMRTRLKPILFALLVALLGLIFVWALWNGFSRGGQDFRVFHYAGRLALEGRTDALYTEGPDRFLYAPGFAFLMSPLSAIPETPALAIWLFATMIAFIAAMRALSKRVGAVPVMLAILFSVRPIAIDLRYGQVNLLILAAAVWALLTWFERVDSRESRRALSVSWFVFGIAACSKIYPLALFLFPLVGLFRETRTGRRSAIAALTGATVGAALLLIPPLLLTGVYPAWLDALARKGLPTDTHNQSLLATLVRVFGGEPFYSLGMGGESIHFSGIALSIAATRVIWGLFSVTVLGALGFLAFREETDPVRRRLVASLGLALCFLPAHLIWKSYFVLGIPLLAVLFADAVKDKRFYARIFYPSLSLGVILAFTSLDFVGARAAAWIESVSPFFWVHCFMISVGFLRLRELRTEK
jgi:hypothetical protein